jgi:hypothetical protein
MIMPMLRASDTGPLQSITTGMVNPMDMWRFRSSVWFGQIQQAGGVSGVGTHSTPQSLVVELLKAGDNTPTYCKEQKYSGHGQYGRGKLGLLLIQTKLDGGYQQLGDQGNDNCNGSIS